MRKTNKEYEKDKDKLILEGRGIFTYSKRLRYYGNDLHFCGYDLGHEIAICNIIAAVCGLLYFIAIPSLILFIIISKMIKVHNYYFSDSAVLLRYLKKKPELVAAILENKNHKYYDLAKKLENAGDITLNVRDGMVEIDGKQYKLKVK